MIIAFYKALYHISISDALQESCYYFFNYYYYYYHPHITTVQCPTGTDLLLGEQGEFSSRGQNRGLNPQSSTRQSGALPMRPPCLPHSNYNLIEMVKQRVLIVISMLN